MAPGRLHFQDSKQAASQAAIAQLGERQTEDLKVPGSIPGLGICFVMCQLFPHTVVIVSARRPRGIFHGRWRPWPKHVS